MEGRYLFRNRLWTDSTEFLPVRDGMRMRIHSILSTWTVVSVKRANLHFSTPECPRPRYRRLHGLPCVVRLFLGQVLEVAFSLRFSGLYLPARLDINFTLQGVAEMGVVDDQCGRLSFGSLLGVYRLVDGFLDAMRQRCEPMSLKQDCGMIGLERRFRFGTRESRSDLRVYEASRCRRLECCCERCTEVRVADEEI